MLNLKKIQCVIIVSLLFVGCVSKLSAQLPWFNDSDTKTSDVQSSRPVNEASKAS